MGAGAGRNRGGIMTPPRYRSPRFIACAFALVFVGSPLLCVAIDWYHFGGALAVHCLALVPSAIGGIGGGL